MVLARMPVAIEGIGVSCICAADAVHRADLLLVIGTSGLVYPAAGLVSMHRGLSIEINPQPERECTFHVAATAAEAMPPIVDAILAA